MIALKLERRTLQLNLSRETKVITVTVRGYEFWHSAMYRAKKS